MTRNRILAATATVAMLGASLFGVGSAFAHGWSGHGWGDNGYGRYGNGNGQAISADQLTNVVNALATRFNLNANDVRSTILQALQQGMATDTKSVLDQAVTNGNISQEDENLILGRQSELQTFLQGLQGMNASDRQDAIQAKVDELKNWADDNDISPRYVLLLLGDSNPRLGKHGFFGPMIYPPMNATSTNGNVTSTNPYGNNATSTNPMGSTSSTSSTPSGI